MSKSFGFKATKAILFAAVLITTAVAVYTTWALFTSPNLGLTFDPEEIVLFSPESNNSTSSNDSDGVSFIFEGDCSDGFGTENVTNRTCNTTVIPPAQRDVRPEPGAISFLATLDTTQTPNGLGLVIMILIEVIVIYVVYRELDIFMHNNN